jgi:drug/metabolite transporter (DMT)-like permease
VPYFASGEHLLPASGNAGAWWALAYIVAFPTVIAYLLNMFALARVRASTTAVYVYAQPLVAVVASRMVFGERMSGAMLLAAIGLFVGVWMVARQVGVQNNGPVVREALRGSGA